MVKLFVELAGVEWDSNQLKSNKSIKGFIEIAL